MKLKHLSIHNYKSLKGISFRPDNISVVVGPNGAGKSNFASAFDFLADTYANGIAFAVAKKGGYENIAYRRKRRTKSAINFALQIVLDATETRTVLRHFVLRSLRELKISSLIVSHSFSIQASSQTLGADFSVTSEKMSIEYKRERTTNEGLKFTQTVEIFAVSRSDGKMRVDSCADDAVTKELATFFTYFDDVHGQEEEEQILFVREFIPRVNRAFASISVHQFAPQICRSPGIPSPEPRLSPYGQNLPALVDWLKRTKAKRWKSVEASMRGIFPGLENISTEFLHTKTLGLFFKEEGFGRPWNAEDVSDGTIQALAIFSSLYDPRSDFVVLEEVENSVHPWIVKNVVKTLRELSAEKQFVLTTHSPVILNLLEPNEVWICYKEEGATHLANLLDLHPELADDWKSGQYRLFDYLDLGVVSKAVPDGA